jgi:hypothetical protein
MQRRSYHYTVPSATTDQRHRVSRGAEGWHCSCAGYRYRQKCRHLDACQRLMARGLHGTQQHPWAVDATPEEVRAEAEQILSEIQEIKR